MHPDGSKLTAREKLLLFVLADYHNDDRDCAWAGLTVLAVHSLTSRRHLITLLEILERKGTLYIERRTQNTNLYRFPLMSRAVASPVASEVASLPSELLALGGEVSASLGSAVATAPKPPKNLHNQPTKESPSYEFETARFKITGEQHQKLQENFPVFDVRAYYSEMDLWLEAKGTERKNSFLFARNWLKREAEKLDGSAARRESALDIEGIRRNW